MIIKGRCHECTGRRLRRGRIIGIHLEEEGGTAHFHPSCFVRWLTFEPDGPRKTMLQKAARAALEARKIVKPAADQSVREALRARVDAMPPAAVPQHPPGWVPEDEEAAS